MSMLRSVLNLGFLVLLLGVLSGCAFKDQKIAIEYQSNNIKGKQKGIICLNKFEDNRIVKHRIGIVKNGYGMETANVLTDQDITIVISKAIKTELDNLGYDVKMINVNFGDGINKYENCDVLDGGIREFFVEPLIEFTKVRGKAIITIDLLVQTQQGKEFKKTYSVNGDASSYMGGSPSLFKETMDNALRNLVLSIKSDMPLIIE